MVPQLRSEVTVMCVVEHSKATKAKQGDGNLVSHFVSLALLLCFIRLTTACGGASQSALSASPSANSAVALSLTPDGATVASRDQIQFTARVSGTSNTAVRWSASAGSISSTGLFTAPEVTSNTAVVITATSSGGPVIPGGTGAKDKGTSDTNAVNSGIDASAKITVTARASASSLAITNFALPPASASVPYTVTLTATGGVTPYQWSFASGSLPYGIQLQTSTGIVTGTTALTGTYPVTAKVTDASGQNATAALDLSISPTATTESSSYTGFDGPAELPRIYIQTEMSKTPAPGSIITVQSGENLQSALNSANCGDTVLLQAGATFTGPFIFPSKNCDDNHWIIVRSSADDSLLPPEGRRLAPCYAGVPSLPSRPAFSCASTKNVLAKLLQPKTGTGPIVFASGANHYRLVGLEITRTAGTGIAYALASVAAGGTADNLIFDRVWMHGTPHDETKKGFELGGVSYGSVIDSYFSDFHCISGTGACTDAAAVGGGVGDPVGPFKIVNNFLEASGENILFGGAQSATTPADIEIGHNHIFKPMIWMQGQPGYVGGANGNPFIVKNLFELKNAQRILLEANIMEGSWGGFSQTGYAILLTPVDQQSGDGSNLCPICQVTDVTIRYNIIKHVGAGLQIASVLSAPGEFPALDGQRYSIHDIVIDDIDAVKYNGGGRFAEIMSLAPDPPIANLSIDHVTAFAKNLLTVSGDTRPRMSNFSLTNSILSVGIYPVWSATGSPTDCAVLDIPVKTFNSCFDGYSFENNALIGTTSSFPPSKWPSGNFFPTTAGAVQFASYQEGKGGNYLLMSTSPYRNAATDGKDLGADVSKIQSVTATVY
jgi:hypothetical protein